jgi:hypothetical protein
MPMNAPTPGAPMSSPPETNPPPPTSPALPGGSGVASAFSGVFSGSLVAAAIPVTLALVTGFGLGRATAPTSNTALGAAPLAPDEALDCSLTDEDLRIACLPVMRHSVATLEEVQTRVDALAVQVATKQTEVRRLEEALGAQRRLPALQPAATPAPNPDEVARLDAARAELASLQAELVAAQNAKVKLEATLTETRQDLAQTQERLVQQQQRTQDTREDLLRQTWLTFVNEAQLTICAEGSRNQVERCRDQVGSGVTQYERRFKACVRSGQAVPELRYARPSEPLPSFAVRLSGVDAARNGWQILFCDPDLPEALPDR